MKITQLKPNQAKNFLMENSSYSTAGLPIYFDFTYLLWAMSDILEEKQLSELYVANTRVRPENFNNINYKLYTSRSEKYDWRKLELIHPLLYVELVNIITKPYNWTKIKNMLKHESLVECLSLPELSNKAESFRNYSSESEQSSLDLLRKYKYLFKTDISNSYDSFDKDLISRALYGKRYLKNDVKKDLFGKQITSILKLMNNGQTKGIPEGSVLMDFIAEINLHHIDLEFSKKINKDSYLYLDQNEIESFKIIRYRDNYSIFTNDLGLAKKLVQKLSDVLKELEMRLNPAKIITNNDVIKGKLKPYGVNLYGNFDDSLLKISTYASKFPNSNILLQELIELHRNFAHYKHININKSMSILVGIIGGNNRTFAVCLAILSKLIKIAPTKEKAKARLAILHNIEINRNSSILALWLQRIGLTHDEVFYSYEPLGRLIICHLSKTYRFSNPELWNSKWINTVTRNIIEVISIVNNKAILGLEEVIGDDKIEIFKY